VRKPFYRHATLLHSRRGGAGSGDDGELRGRETFVINEGNTREIHASSRPSQVRGVGGEGVCVSRPYRERMARALPGHNVVTNDSEAGRAVAEGSRVIYQSEGRKGGRRTETIDSEKIIASMA